MDNEQVEWDRAARVYAERAERETYNEVCTKVQAFLAAHPRVTNLRVRVADAESGRVELAFRVGDAYWCGEGEGVYLPDADERVEGTHGLALAALDLASYIRDRSWVMGDAWVGFPGG